MHVSPSLLSADFTQLAQQLHEVEATPAEWIHFDVMDGHFVKNLTFGPDILKAVQRSSSLFRDVHLMITDPAAFASAFIAAGAQVLTFHIDAVDDVEASLNLMRFIKDQGVLCGISQRPSLPMVNFQPFLELADLVLVMSVEPGFGGQAFMPDALDRIAWLHEAREVAQANYLIEVDGGINAQTGQAALDAGADVLVAGSYVFKGDIAAAVDSLWRPE